MMIGMVTASSRKAYLSGSLGFGGDPRLATDKRGGLQPLISRSEQTPQFEFGSVGVCVGLHRPAAESHRIASTVLVELMLYRQSVEEKVLLHEAAVSYFVKHVFDVLDSRPAWR